MVVKADARATDRPTRVPDAARSHDRHAAFANSPYEVDWLLNAAIMTDGAKQRYCLERALAINPGSDVARRALARLTWHEEA